MKQRFKKLAKLFRSVIAGHVRFHVNRKSYRLCAGRIYYDTIVYLYARLGYFTISIEYTNTEPLQLPKSENDWALIHAVRKGYRISSDGVVTGLNGTILKLKEKTENGYYRFNIKFQENGLVKHNYVSVHRLQAYQKFGNLIFDPKVQVRHLDGNPQNNQEDNIEIGTQSQNIMDVPEDQRVKRATHASRQKQSAHSQEFWEKIKQEHRQGLSYKDISQKYKVSKSSISYQLNKSRG